MQLFTELRETRSCETIHLMQMTTMLFIKVYELLTGKEYILF